MPTVLEEEFEDENDTEKENEHPRVETAPRVKDPVLPTQSPPRVKKPLQPIPVSPNMPRTRRTIAQYKKQLNALKKATPDKNIPVPITPEKAPRQSPRWLPHMATMTTPCGISSKAVGKLLTKHLLDLHAPSFIPACSHGDKEWYICTQPD